MLDTKFKYNTSALQIFIYTIDGKGDPLGSICESQINIGQMAPMENESALYLKSHSLIDISKRAGFNVIDCKESKITIDQRNAFEVVINGELKGRDCIIYSVVTGNSNEAISFQGVAFTNQDEYLREFKAIAQTVKLK